MAELLLFSPEWCPMTISNCCLGAPCEPVHQTTQKDRQSSVICWENPFNVSVKIHSLRELAVDEIMLKFRGRFMGKPYMSKKPTKWGTKSFSLADSCNGYIINVLLLCRRGAFSRTGCFFLLYAKLVPPSWIAITSPLPSQSCPLTSSSKSSQPFLWRQCCKVRCCCSLSVWLCATDEAVQPRRWMDVFDIPDQHAVYYFFLRKTVKWTLEKALFWLIETAVVDSYILCNCTVIPRRPNHLAYWHAIAESLANKKLAYKKKPHLFASKIYSTFTWTINKPHLP